MNGEVALAEGARIATGEHGLHFRHDGESDLLGAVGSQIQPDGCVQLSSLLSRKREAGGAEVIAEFVSAFSRSKQTKVGERSIEQCAQKGQIVDVVVGHYDCERIGTRCDARHEVISGTGDNRIRHRETAGSGKRASRIRDGDVPSEFLRQPDQRLGVIASTKDSKGGGRGNRF